MLPTRAFALDFVDFYKTTWNNDIDNPGLLAASLISMGDGTVNGTPRVYASVNNLYGAGRLKARKFDSAGMDGPAAWALGWTCVSHNEVVEFPAYGGSPLAADVDVYRATIFWYDSSHDTDGSIDDIDLRLVNANTGAALSISSSGTNDVEQIRYSDPGSLAVTLQIIGYWVTSDDSGCGANAQKVYYTRFYEDSDRDDADGPGSEIEAE